MEDIKVSKSEDFAILIIELVKYLQEIKHEYIISKQLLKSGTSIGANIAESIGSESDADFVHKITIPQKEGFETAYWLKLLFKTHYIDKETYYSLNNKCQELLRILTAIIRKMKGTS